MSSESTSSDGWRAAFHRRAQLRSDRRVERAAALAAIVADHAQGFLRAYGARRLVLCGSVARGEVHEASDLDLLVEGLARESEASARRWWQERVDAAGHRDTVVDLRTADGLDEVARERIAAQAVQFVVVDGGVA